MTVFETCWTEEPDAGERLVIDVGGRKIGVVNVDGEFVAVANDCVHAGGPVGVGMLSGMVAASPDEWEYDWKREGEILACPWHGWEFDIFTGEHLSNQAYRLLTDDVRVSDGTVYVDTGGPGTEDVEDSSATAE